MVRRQPGGLDDGDALFSDATVRRLRLRAFQPIAAAESAGGSACRSAGRGGLCLSHTPGADLETAGWFGPGRAHIAPAFGVRWASLFRSLGDGPAGAGVVCARLSGAIAVSALFAVERRLAIGAADVSVFDRASVCVELAGFVLENRIRGVRPIMRFSCRARWNQRPSARRDCRRHRADHAIGDRQSLSAATRRFDIGCPRAADRGTERQRSFARLGPPAVVARFAGICVADVFGDDQPRLPGCGRDSVSVDRAVEPVSVVVHHLLRPRALVHSTAVRRRHDSRLSRRRILGHAKHVDALRQAGPSRLRQNSIRRGVQLRRHVSGLHVVPRRVGSPAAASALS